MAARWAPDRCRTALRRRSRRSPRRPGPTGSSVVGERESAAVLRSQADLTRDAAVATVLREAAEDEDRHATLAEDVVAWACREDGDAAARVEALSGSPLNKTEFRWVASEQDTNAVSMRPAQNDRGSPVA
jgi:hypothetical protein